MKTKSYPFLPGGAFALAALVAGCAVTSLLPAAFGAPAQPDVRTPAEQASFPVLLSSVRPEYPWQLKRAGVTGEVKVRCRIDEAGRVRDPVVLNATDDAFIKPALAALRQWTFRPAQQDGRPVAREISIPIRFRLNE